MSIKKDKYEISVWEDYIVSYVKTKDTSFNGSKKYFELINGEYIETEDNSPDIHPNKTYYESVVEHYEERKLMIIGSDTMSAAWRATEPKLVENINGTNTFTFKMYYTYINTETGEKEENPAIKLLVNERKVKCFWKDKWYDFVIKACQEDSNGKSITYTCKDLFVNELSKNGFDLIFDTELENNQGSVQELGEKVLEGTDWKLDVEHSDIISQYKEEPVYEVNVLNNFTAIDPTSANNEQIEVKQGSKILVFYSVVLNQNGVFQFWYDSTQQFLTDNSSMLVDSGNSLSTQVTWNEDKNNNLWIIKIGTNEICKISKEALTSSRYRAKRAVQQQKQVLDPTSDKYVYIYKAKKDINYDSVNDENNEQVHEVLAQKDDIIYGYQNTFYDDVLTIENYITNNKNFKSTEGWSGTNLSFQLYPIFTDEIELTYTAKSYLGIPGARTVEHKNFIYDYKDGKRLETGKKQDGNTRVCVYNSGLNDYKGSLKDGFKQGEEYIFRCKATYDTNPLEKSDRTHGPTNRYFKADMLFLTFFVAKKKFNKDKTKYIPYGSRYLEPIKENGRYVATQNGDWVEYTIKCNKSIPYAKLDDFGIFIRAENDMVKKDGIMVANQEYRWIESIQFFKKSNGEPIIQDFKNTEKYVEDEVVKIDENTQYKCIRDTTEPYYEKIDISIGATVKAGNYKLITKSNRDNILTLLTKDEAAEKNIDYYKRIEYFTKVDNVSTGEITNIYYWQPYKDKDSYRINPGCFGSESYAIPYWNFYKSGQSVLNPEDLEYLYMGAVEDEKTSNWISENLIPVINKRCEKIRSITEKNSNRFNLLQKLAETFECWVKFDIQHDNTGKIKYYDNNGTYIGPQKTVRFVEEVGQETGVGFIYGIDLKAISRTINSDNITSKVIVTQNNNEYATNKICTIQRASENYPGVNYILNFDYYITQGLVEADQVNKDLYSSVDSVGMGYFYRLHNFNKKLEDIATLLSKRKDDLMKQESNLKIIKNQFEQTAEEINNQEQFLSTNWLKQNTFNEEKIKNKVNKEPENNDLQSAWLVRQNLLNIQSQYGTQVAALERLVKNLKTEVKNLDSRHTAIEESIEKLDQEFYSKYSRFIQEGSWTSEDYYDDNLYYLDALSVAYTSSRPQITYNISVLRLSALEEFKNKVFNLGDISFVQDTEFFGYIYTIGDGQEKIKTPYKEKVLISEVTSNFDSPENDSFKVQNYKTQFEDLFQRITATTQSLQYAKGEYNKAANSFTQTGEINPDTLQRSFTYNQNLAWAATNDSVVYNNTGITVTDVSNPNLVVRISSRGIQMSEDGGLNWRLGVTGSGISTQYLTAGTIATNKINIMDGNYPTFRWDKYGLSAFAFQQDKDGNITQVVDSQFVRYDRFGIYGIRNEQSLNWMPATQKDIEDRASFGLLWDKFFMKNSYKDGGYVSISSDNDFMIVDGKGNTRIKIGKIDEINNLPVYGLFLVDQNGSKVMETDSTGSLWLKDRLNIGTNNSNYQVGIGKLNIGIYIQTTDKVFNNQKVYYELIYQITTDTTFEPDKQYYELDEYGNYFLTTDKVFNSEKKYYEQIYQITTDITLQQNKIYYEKNYQIMNANDNFIIYEDGSIFANNGQFNGIISAIEGSIGDISITENGLIGKNFFLTNDSGLTIYDNGLTIIKKENNQTLLSFDTEQQKLNIAGDVIFSGELKGANGTFTGSLIAPSGNIGGFTIKDNKLVSDNNTIELIGRDYIKTKDTAFDSEKTYYELIDGEYVETTDKQFSYIQVVPPYVEGNIYYTQNDDGTYTQATPPYSDDSVYYQSKVYYELANSGKIIANDIEIGTGATIVDYIKLDNSYIYNPSKHNNIFLSVKKIETINNVEVVKECVTIKNDGTASFGQIDVNGAESKISGTKFLITPEKAIFSNVEVSGTIHTSVFETGSIQTVGGAMLFKESAQIDSIEKDENNENIYTIKTVSKINLKENSVVLLTGEDRDITCIVKSINTNDGSIKVKTTEDISAATSIVQIADVGGYDRVIPEINSGKTYYTYNPNTNEYESTTNITADIIYYEKNNNKLSNNLIIGVNSQSFGNKNLLPEAITFRKYIRNEKGDFYDVPLLVLGNLESLQKPGLEGYGLYGENVYLSGSITTIRPGENESYAGINTLSRVKSTVFSNANYINEGTDDYIIFYAGAPSSGEAGIQAAAFQVVENGSLYCNHGIFKGSVVVDSEIHSSNIYAANIYPNKEGAALSIYDTAQNAGIYFKKKEDDSITLILSEVGFYLPALGNNLENKFIDFQERNVLFKGQQFTTTLDKDKYLNISGYSIRSFLKNTEGTNIEIGSLNFEDVIVLSQESDMLKIGKNKIEIETLQTTLSNDLKLGDKMNYQKVNNGYDLYISD